jgi:hypothetical protein
MYSRRRYPLRGGTARLGASEGGVEGFERECGQRRVMRIVKGPFSRLASRGLVGVVRGLGRVVPSESRVWAHGCGFLITTASFLVEIFLPAVGL